MINSRGERRTKALEGTEVSQQTPSAIIIFICSNYLSVSGEHRVHYNTNICSRFCCTTHPFQAFGYPSLLPYMGGSVFILVFRRECVPNAAVYFKAISPMTLHHRFLVSLHIHDTTYSFRISPCPCVHCCGFGIVALHRDRLFVCNWFLLASSMSANKH